MVSQKALKENLYEYGPEEEEDDEFLGFDPTDSEDEADEEGLEGPDVPSKPDVPYVKDAVLKILRKVAGLNLMLFGIPIPILVGLVMGTAASKKFVQAGMLGPLFFSTFIGSLILYTICSVLLGRESS